ncbi:MAG: hypothetical protein C0502_06145 [Opitutus sp.]|nr:hypothetical protein [Opitutus sp.]
MPALEKSVVLAVTGAVRLLLGAYFRRIEVYHADRVPAGPVLFVANHPGSVTDAFVVGTSAPRRPHFLATAQLFRFAPLAWLLHRAGIIPLNRREDDPAAMRSVADSFGAAHRVFDAGGVVVIFPEGVTYDDSRLRTLKSGAARLALDYEQRHAGRGGLHIVPLGLTYSAKERFRSDVLVFFGPPLPVANFLPQYAERRKECIAGLTEKIARRMQALLVHVPQMEREHTVEAVKRLYLPRLRLGNLIIQGPVPALTEEVVLTHTIADAVDFASREMPEHMAAFLARLRRYEGLLRRLHLSDEAVEELASHRRALPRILGWSAAALLLLPVAAAGWLHWRLPTQLVESLARRFSDPKKRKAQAPHARMLAGAVIYGAAFALYVGLVQRWLGWPASGWYALALPLTGFAGHYYLKQAALLLGSARTASVLLRAPLARRRVLRMRAALIRDIEQVRRAYRAVLKPGLEPGAVAE